MKEGGFRVRVEKDLHEEFMATCRRLGRNGSEVIRNLMRDYVAREYGGLQASLFERADSKQANKETKGGASSWHKRS